MKKKPTKDEVTNLDLELTRLDAWLIELKHAQASRDSQDKREEARLVLQQGGTEMHRRDAESAIAHRAQMELLYAKQNEALERIAAALEAKP